MRTKIGMTVTFRLYGVGDCERSNDIFLFVLYRAKFNNSL